MRKNKINNIVKNATSQIKREVVDAEFELKQTNIFVSLFISLFL